MKRNKRALLVVAAAVFVVVIFSIKSSSTFNNESKDTGLSGGLTYNTTVLKDLVNKDSDRDGILDWEEGLWGTDPNNKDSDGDGTPDDVEIASLKAGLDADASVSVADDENLTETDKFSRELVATMAAISQTGEIDQASIDQLGSNLADKIGSMAQKKIYKPSDIKIISDNSPQAVAKYSSNLDNIFSKYKFGKSAVDVMYEMLQNEETNSESLAELEQIIKDTQGVINAMVGTSVPNKIAPQHLALINALQGTVENLEGVTLVESDSVIALGAVSKYIENMDVLDTTITKLSEAINQGKGS